MYGKVMPVNNERKINTGDKTKMVKTCTNEAERGTALRDYFDIELMVEEVEGI